MTTFGTREIAASVSRASWGEVTDNLRRIRFRADGNRIDLCFVFDGDPADENREAMGDIGAEVAADFPDSMVGELALPAAPYPGQPEWHIAFARAFARKEPSPAD